MFKKLKESQPHNFLGPDEALLQKSAGFSPSLLAPRSSSIWYNLNDVPPPARSHNNSNSSSCEDIQTDDNEDEDSFSDDEDDVSWPLLKGDHAIDEAHDLNARHHLHHVVNPFEQLKSSLYGTFSERGSKDGSNEEPGNPGCMYKFLIYLEFPLIICHGYFAIFVQYIEMFYNILICFEVIVPICMGNLSVWVCSTDILNIRLGKFMVLQVITPGIVFCMCFAIQESYRRRERALGFLAQFKTTLISLEWYLYGRKDSKELRKLLLKLCLHIARYLPSETDPGGCFTKVYADFFNMFKELKKNSGMDSMEAVKWSQDLILSFENLRNIKDYRTPYSLDGFSRIMLVVLPIALGSYFAHGCEPYDRFADEEPDCTSEGMGYFYSSLYFLCLGSLRVVQTRIENPYDEVSDFNVDIQEEMEEILKLSSKYTYHKSQSIYLRKTQIITDKENNRRSSRKKVNSLASTIDKKIDPLLLEMNKK